jgi:hypothetical protein
MALIWELVACSVCSQIDTHFSNGRSSTSVLRCCSFQFHLMPFLPIEVQVIVHTGTATMVIMFPLLTFSAHLSRTMPDTKLHLSYSGHCSPHTTILPSFPLLRPGTHLCQSFSPLNLRSVSCRLPSLTDPDPSQPSYLPILVGSPPWAPGRGECLSER